MKMIPFFSLDGTILGHINVDMCGRTRNSIIIDNGPTNWSNLSVPTSPDDMNPIEIYHLPFYEIKFCTQYDEIVVNHLVVDDSKLPSWFWDVKAIMKFSSETWKAV